MSERGTTRPLVLDTSVAVKFYLPEELREEAMALLAAVGDAFPELLAPGTIQPELFNALWQQHRRDALALEEVGHVWSEFISNNPITLYAPEDLMSRAVEIALETGTIIYDALFLALAQDTGTVVVTADGTLLRDLRGTPYAHLALSLAEVEGEIRQEG